MTRASACTRMCIRARAHTHARTHTHTGCRLGGVVLAAAADARHLSGAGCHWIVNPAGWQRICRVLHGHPGHHRLHRVGDCRGSCLRLQNEAHERKARERRDRNGHKGRRWTKGQTDPAARGCPVDEREARECRRCLVGGKHCSSTLQFGTSRLGGKHEHACQSLARLHAGVLDED